MDIVAKLKYIHLYTANHLDLDNVLKPAISFSHPRGIRKHLKTSIRHCAKKNNAIWFQGVLAHQKHEPFGCVVVQMPLE